MHFHSSPSVGVKIAEYSYRNFGGRYRRGGSEMTAYTVYRAEYRTNKTVRIGRLVDHRRAERNNNEEDMLRMAQKLYATSSNGSRIFIVRERSRLRLLFESPLPSRTAAGS